MLSLLYNIYILYNFFLLKIIIYYYLLLYIRLLGYNITCWVESYQIKDQTLSFLQFTKQLVYSVQVYK